MVTYASSLSPLLCFQADTTSGSARQEKRPLGSSFLEIGNAACDVVEGKTNPIPIPSEFRTILWKAFSYALRGRLNRCNENQNDMNSTVVQPYFEYNEPRNLLILQVKRSMKWKRNVNGLNVTVAQILH